MSEMVISIREVQNIMAHKGYDMTEIEIYGHYFDDELLKHGEKDPVRTKLCLDLLGTGISMLEHRSLQHFWDAAFNKEIFPVLVLGPISLTVIEERYYAARSFTALVEKFLQGPTVGINYHKAHETPSQKTLDQLKPAGFMHLMGNTKNHGVYYLCRTYCLPVLFGSGTARFIVVDPFGFVSMLDVDNAPLLPPHLGNPVQSDYDFAYPPGTVLAIKEPRVFRRYSYSMENARFWPGVVPQQRATGLRHVPSVFVDSPTEMVVLDKGHKLRKGLLWCNIDDPAVKVKGEYWKYPQLKKRSLEQWSAKGNEAFKAGRYMEALYYFKSGLQQHANHPKRYLLHLNLSAVYVILERWHDIRKTCDQALSLLDDLSAKADEDIPREYKQKALVRKAFALYRLRRWQDAKEMFCLAGQLYPASESAKAGVRKCLQRQSEARSGHYDFDGLFQAATSRTSRTLLDAADYVGPVRLGMTERAGRGLVATEDIKAGDLIMVNKAILTVSRKFTGHRYAMTTMSGFDIAGRPVPSGTESIPHHDGPIYTLFKRGLTYHNYHRPELAKYFGNLYGGEAYPMTSESNDIRLPVIDESEKIAVDFGRTRAISYYNTFGVSHSDLTDPNDDQVPQGVIIHNSICFLNHACLPNCTMVTVGDLASIRANCNIEKNAMLTLDYGGGTQTTAQDRRDVTQHYFPGDCYCTICVHDRGMGLKRVESREKECLRVKDILKSRYLSLMRLSESGASSHSILVRKHVSDLMELWKKHLSECLGDPTTFNVALSNIAGNLFDFGQFIPDFSREMAMQTLEFMGIVLRGREQRSRGILFLKHAPKNNPFRSLPIHHNRYRSPALYLIESWSHEGNHSEALYWLRGVAWAELMFTGSLQRVQDDVRPAKLLTPLLHEFGLLKKRYQASTASVGLDEPAGVDL